MKSIPEDFTMSPAATEFAADLWNQGVVILHQGENPKDRLASRKSPIGLVPPALAIYCAQVFELGAKKYGAYNWRKTKVRYSVYLEAALRHIYAAMDGEDIDDESGVPHAAHVAACMAILLDGLDGNRFLVDDRPSKGPAADLLRKFTKKGAL